MPVDDIYLGNIENEFQGNANTYSFYLRVETVNDEDNISAGVLEFLAARRTALLPLHSLLVTFRCNTVRQVWPNKSLPESDITGLIGSRTCTAGVLPGQCSAVITLYGDKANPTQHNRGRDFMTGACVDDQVNGTWFTGPASYLQDWCDYYQTMTNSFTDSFGNVFDIGIFSLTQAKKTIEVPPQAVVFFWPLNFVRGRSLVRTQRRRQPEDPCEEVCDAPIS